MKHLKFIYLLSIIFITSCSKESVYENEKQLKSEATINNEVTNKAASKKVYHFIKFNIKNKNLTNKFINEVIKMARNNNGKLLTKGKPICIERNCADRNLVIEFKKRANGKTFFKTYRNKLTELSNKATKNLSYRVGKESLISGVNSNTKPKGYLILETNITNFNAYDSKYVPTAVRVATTKYKGRFFTSDVTECLLGDCTTYSVVIGYRSQSDFFKSFNDKEYRPVIPFRQNNSKGGSLFFAKAN